MLPLQGVWVQSPVGELRSHMPHSTAQKLKKKKRKHLKFGSNSWEIAFVLLTEPKEANYSKLVMTICCDDF